MSRSERMGDIQEELVIEWRLKDFVKNLKDDDELYTSSPFSFAGHSWCIRMYPYGRICDKPTEYIGLYLRRISLGSAIEIKFLFGLKTLCGGKDLEVQRTTTFNKGDTELGSTFLKMSKLLERKCDLLPSDVLTVICTLQNQKSTGTETNKKLLNDMKELMLSGQHSDTTIKVKDEELQLHRSILASRNPFFRAMFDCEMKEKATGNVSIEDCEPEVFRSFIHFVYTGKVDKLSSENVCELYNAADKYQEDQLKNICLQFMMNELSVDNIFDFIVLALKNDEKALLQNISEFFCKKAKTIIRSVRWQNFIKEYPTEANELFIKTLDHYVNDDNNDNDDRKDGIIKILLKDV